ncbi:MAG: hypothetical protein P1U75_04835 [Antarcticimicrobium sp.]|uniref:hypothetical protein n=1 Tax=Antarcticimicrobium sp. TaxID=2824147 RepID=UPI0026030051|nr:hypothetical protein [Antarcticimicrobium sp.]MDF1715987.1 hypothetical protein [Antarcticimicrobium sp.]
MALKTRDLLTGQRTQTINALRGHPSSNTAIESFDRGAEPGTRDQSGYFRAMRTADHGAAGRHSPSAWSGARQALR